MVTDKGEREGEKGKGHNILAPGWILINAIGFQSTP